MTNTDLIMSSILGIGRGLSVHTIIHPFDVVKTHQQAQKNPEMAYKIAIRLFKQEGLAPFYKGLCPQLIRTSLKQAWCWPVITGLPVYLRRHTTNPLLEQALTGFFIATLDAAISTPLERARVLAIVKKQQVSLQNVFQGGWHGFIPYWAKLSIAWSTFLVSQKYFRDQTQAQSKESTLTLPELVTVGTKVAAVVSLTSAPFDVINTLKQAGGLEPLNQHTARRLFRGLPLSTFCLVVHNVVSVTLIDKMSQKTKS